MSTKSALKQLGKNAPPKKVLKQIQALQGLGKFQECRPLCERLIGLGFNNPDFLHVYGLTLRGCGDLRGALVAIHAAHEQKPEDVRILNSLGAIFLQMDDVETAIELFKRTTSMDQRYYDGWLNLGLALKRVERYQAADLAFTCAHHIDPARIDPLLNLVDILIELRVYKRAEEFMDKLLAQQSEITPRLQLKRLQIAARVQDLDYIRRHRETADRESFSQDEKAELDNIWVHHLEIENRHEEAITVLEPWMNQETIHKTQLQTQLGLFYSVVGRVDEAIAVHETLLRSHPDHIAGRYNLAHLQFKTGRLKEGFENYEARWQWKEFSSHRRRFDALRWDGEPLTGKNLLVWREQGIGDEVRYSSLLPELESLGATVTFECSPKLLPLFEHAFPWARLRPEGPIECRGMEEYSEFDYQIPIGSLAKHFRPTIEAFEERHAPWIPRSTEAESEVRAQLGIRADELLVGICWRSANQAASRNRYYFGIEHFEPLKDLPGIRWVNVQYDATAEEIGAIRDMGLALHHFTNVNQKDDLVTTCALLGACDIVISAPVSVADLTGGLGVPTAFVIQEDSPAFLGTDHIPWFPAAKPFVIRQNGGEEVIRKIANDWPSIMDWAKRMPAARQQAGADGRAPTHSPEAVSLDLEYVSPAA